MEDSISMWSIILPVISTAVITGITAYCIYQQNKHYLKVKLLIQKIDGVRKLIPQPNLLENGRKDAFELLIKYQLELGINLFYLQCKMIDLSCFERLNLEAFEEIDKDEKAKAAFKGYEDVVNSYNYIEVLWDSLCDSIGMQLDWILKNYEELDDNLPVNSMGNKYLNNINDTTRSIEFLIIQYISRLELKAVAETVSFMQPIKESLTTIRNKTINVKNKLLDWETQSKK